MTRTRTKTSKPKRLVKKTPRSFQLPKEPEPEVVVEAEGTIVLDDDDDPVRARERQALIDLDLDVQRLLGDQLTFNAIALDIRKRHNVGYSAIRKSITRVRKYLRERENRDQWLKRQESLEWLYRMRKRAASMMTDKKGKVVKEPDMNVAMQAQKMIIALEGTEAPKRVKHSLDESEHDRMINQALGAMPEEEIAKLDAEWEETSRLASITRAQLASGTKH